MRASCAGRMYSRSKQGPADRAKFLLTERARWVSDQTRLTDGGLHFSANEVPFVRMKTGRARTPAGNLWLSELNSEAGSRRLTYGVA